MARSQSKTRLFFSEHPLALVLVSLAALFLIVGGVAAGLRGAFEAFGSTESMASEQTASQAPTSEPVAPEEAETPATSEPGIDAHLETGDLTEDTDCSTNKPADQYAALVERILTYEEARLTPGFEANEEALKLYATQDYIKSHSRAADPDDPTDLTVSVDRANSTVTCFIVSDSRIIVQAWPVFSTYRVNEAGESELVNQFTDPLVHATGWLLVKGVWMVDSDVR